METESHQPKEREGVISVLNGFIEAFSLAKEISSNTPAKAVFGSVNVLLVMIRDTMANEADYVELGLVCGNVCDSLKRGLDGKSEDDLSDSIREAIKQLRKAIEEMQGRITKQGKRNMISRHLRAKNDKERIAAWRLDLNRILHVFNTELAINTHVTVSGTHTVVSNTHAVVSDTHAAVSNTHAMVSNTHAAVSDTHTMVSDIHRTIVHGREEIDNEPSIRASPPGEFPPPPPRTFFGRDELIKKTVDLAEDLRPIALIGSGGIGKTSVALTVLHHDRIKQRFGHDRRFIRCDQFIASCTHFLRRLSGVIGAGVENPEDLSPLRAFLSSKEMLIVLDNAESILDPQGADARGIYAVVEELSQFNNLCILITSRISTTPPDFAHLDVPTLSMNAAHDTFCRIYGNDNETDLVNGILEQLDFHPLSITLLAMVGRQNKWDVKRLAREWEERRTGVLETEHNNSLAATIELSLASPLFRQLGPDARSLLEVVAFFPQGVDENNLKWLFPLISDRNNIFDKFCILSLTYRNGGFATMLAPLRDYLCPKNPTSSSLLRTVKERYFSRMSVHLDPGDPGLVETQWITSEDINVEHLLDVFTTMDAGSNDVWKACSDFLNHLYWHKIRLTILGPKIEGLPAYHSFKPECLLRLGLLFDEVGNWAESKRLLTHALGLWRGGGNAPKVAETLRSLSSVNDRMDLCKEGIEQAREAIRINEWLGDTPMQTDCLTRLASLLCKDGQLGAAEGSALHAIKLLGDKGNQFLLSGSHRTLGNIYRSKGETEKAISHFKMALDIATPLNRQSQLFWIHHDLAMLFCDHGKLEDAQAHIERAKSCTTDSAYYLGSVAELQATVWCQQHRFKEAKFEALRAVDIFEKLGAAKDVELCRAFLKHLQAELDAPVFSG